MQLKETGSEAEDADCDGGFSVEVLQDLVSFNCVERD